VDAVVNAANSSLMGGGGVDGAIHRAGGPAILSECRTLRSERYPGGLPTGQAVATTGGNLPASHVIHTVGPVYRDGRSGEPDLLRSAYRESLNVARLLGATTVAFPAISTGVYGYPKAEAARVAYAAVRDHLGNADLPATVLLVFRSEADAAAFVDAARPV
jgi:O-acetyl-ADP-ribose deacetylase (regulator of RNase III)